VKLFYRELFMTVRSLFLLIVLMVFMLPAITPCFADDALDHFEKGNIYSKEGKYELAMKEFRKAIKINPKIADYHYNLANMLFATDKVKEAIVEYKKAISLNPLDSDFHRNLGIAYIATGEISKAKEILIDLKKMNPEKAKQLETFLAGKNKK